MKKNIALISPSKEAYSETFIQQHRNNLYGNIFYYFNGSVPRYSDKEGVLLSKKMFYCYIIKKQLKKISFSKVEYALLQSFKRQKIQVVIAEYGTTAVAIYKVCSYLKLPLIPIFHGYDASIKKTLEQYNEGYKKLFKDTFKIVAVSSKIKKTLVNLGCKQEKIIVTPCAPNDVFFDVKPEYKGQTFIAIGRFVDKKAPYYTILAFSKVLKKFPEATLIMAGEGMLLPVCKNLINYLEIQDNVKLIGSVSHKKVLFLYENAIAFVQHSIVAYNGDSEGTPVAILEASAASLPVISTFHAGIPDVIKDKSTGFLVKEHDVEEMARKMIVLLEDISLVKKMGLKGKINVKENFSKEKHIETLNQIIKEIE